MKGCPSYKARVCAWIIFTTSVNIFECCVGGLKLEGDDSSRKVECPVTL